MNISKAWLELDEEILQSIGSLLLYDALFLFVFPPLSLLSLAGNMLSFRTLSTRYFLKKPLYTYLRVCCLNSSIINFIYAVSFICDSRRFLSVANSELATYFRCYLKIPILNLCYFYGSLLDIVLAVERLVEFTQFKQRFRRIEPKRASLVLLTICVIINAPYLLVFEPKKKLISTLDSQHVMLYFYGESQFALSPGGKVFKNIQYFIRDICTLIALVVINLISLLLFRREYRLERPLKSQSSQPLKIESKMSGTSESFSSACRALNRPMSTSLEVIRNKIDRNNLHLTVSQVNIMLMKMVLIICTFASFEHLFLTLSLQMFSNYLQRVKLHVIFVANLSMLLKHSVQVFIFYYFNAQFRNRFNDQIKKMLKF